MRIFSAVVLLVLASCSSDPVENSAAPLEEATADAERIDCATSGQADMTKSCTLERGAENVIFLRHEDGSFRKLTLEADGTIDTADGAETIDLQPLSDGRTEIKIGEDRYRLPADL